MANQKVKTTQVECWGNPTEALEVLRQFNNTNDQSFIRHAIAKLCCLLTPLGFNCSMSFNRNHKHHCIFNYFCITIGDELFSYLGDEQTGDDIEAIYGRIADFISKHTEKDGLFHYTYERRAEA